VSGKLHPVIADTVKTIPSALRSMHTSTRRDLCNMDATTGEDGLSAQAGTARPGDDLARQPALRESKGKRGSDHPRADDPDFAAGNGLVHAPG